MGKHRLLTADLRGFLIPLGTALTPLGILQEQKRIEGFSERMDKLPDALPSLKNGMKLQQGTLHLSPFPCMPADIISAWSDCREHHVSKSYHTSPMEAVTAVQLNQNKLLAGSLEQVQCSVSSAPLRRPGLAVSWCYLCGGSKPIKSWVTGIMSSVVG